ncbi:vacuolar membrane-associated protein iml1, partial [Coemansia sp. RSA 2675]
MLRVHEDTFSLSDLVLNPAFFPGIREGDIVAIRPMPDGDDSNGDQTLSKGLLDTESGTSGAHSSEPPNTGKGKGAGPPHSKPSATPANGGQVADTGERGSDLKTGPARAELRDQSRGAPLDAKSDNDGGHHTDQPLSSSNSKAPSRGPATRDGNDEHVSEVDRADSDHNESILRPDPHREILLNVGEVRRDTQQLQASVSSSIVRALWGDYLANQRVNIRKVDIFNAEERESIRADFVEIAFRDQYVGRSDMWRLWRSLSLKTVHNNKPANMEGLIRASVRRIYKDGRQIPCGYIDLQSQPIFRSESGRFLIFIQMSEEMWSYQEDGNLCFEKVVNSFLAELFRRWKEKQLNHMVTIVMFSRWFYNVRDSLFFQDLILDEDSGKYYRDYYKVIADMEVRPDWSAFLPEILSESNSYRRDIQEIQTSAGHRLRGDLSKAHQGNILEAINLGINSFASHHVDRDLSRTGLSTIVITPSFGVFDVTKNMLRMTTERMLHYGMRTDLVCLAPRPLFKPPLFRFKAPIVPTEQEQMRALLLREQDRIIARKARDTELNSVSPLDEGPPGFISPVTSMPASALPKDRGEKAPLPAPAQAVVDPIMLDPLYFNDENWEQNLLPYLAGSRHRSNAADDGAKAPTGLAARTTAFGSNERDTKPNLGSMFSDSIASALISNHGNVSDIPSSILELRTADYPFFAQSTTSSASRDNRIVYYYFPYWVDCGFYNIDEPASEHDSKFRPRCKMDDLPITGVANYMRVAPSVPDLDLSVFDPELLAAQKFDTQSVSGIDSIADGRFKYRDEDSRSIDAQFFSATRDIGHGRILPLDRKLPLGHSRERLLDLFAEYDRQAITGLGTNRGIAAGAMSVGDLAPGGGGGADSAAGAMSQSVQLTHTGGTSEHRLPLGSLHAASQQSILLPSNASVHWDDHQQGPYSRHLDSRVATERIEVGSAGSVEALDNLLATVSTSASPNLGHGQLIKPPPRAEHCASTSSSVPRDASLGGVGMAGAQRSSIFMRNSSQRKRPQQHVKMQSSLEAAEPTESNMPPTAPQASQRRIAQGHGASPERSLYSIASGSRSR